MIYSIKGKIIDTMPGAVAVENNGIAFYVNVPDNSYAFIAPAGEDVTLYTSMIVREDDISLYGFSDKAGLALFKLLMTVSGVGAKAALAILSVGSPSEIKRAISFEDSDALQQANGIGKKTAQRIVLELKDKIEKTTDISDIADTDKASEGQKQNILRTQAANALIALGYSRQEALQALSGIQAETTEEYIAAALRSR